MIHIKKKIKAVIFDMDGTILKTEQFWLDATVDLLSARGITQFTPEQQAELKSYSGIGHKVAAELLKREYKLAEEAEHIAEEMKQRAETRYLLTVEFVAGFEKFAEELKEHNIAVGLATNADIPTLNKLAEKMNLQKFFGDKLFSMSHVGNLPKPHPAVFLHTADQLQAKPEECVVFEDTIFGINAAKAAGMKVIAIKTQFNEAHRDHAHHAIEHYGEAIEAIKKLVLDNHLGESAEAIVEGLEQSFKEQSHDQAITVECSEKNSQAEKNEKILDQISDLLDEVTEQESKEKSSK